MSLPIDENTLTLVLTFISYLFSLMIGTMLSGITLTIDKKRKIRGSDGKYIGFWRQIGFLILDLVISSLLATFASASLREILWEYVAYLPAVVSGIFLIFILWFCDSFSYKAEKHWKAFAILGLIIVGNILYVYNL